MEVRVFFFHFFEDTDGVWHTGVQNVIGIYQKQAGIRIQICIGFERGIFIRKAHDPTVCVCTFDRDIEHLSGQHVGSSHAAADHSSSCTVDTGIRALGTAKTEFHDTVALCSVNHARGFGGDQTLMVDDI